MSHTNHSDTKKNFTPLSAFPFSFKASDPDPFSAGPSFQALGASLLTRPWIPIQKTIKLTTEQSRVLSSIFLTSKTKGVEAAKAALKGDRRFSADEWSDNRRYSAMALSYMYWRRGIMELIDEAPGLDEITRLKTKFFAEQMVDMMAPSNVPFLNPQVIATARETRGRSLVNGFRNWLGDVRKGSSVPTQSPEDAFVIGKDLANTPGEVVARNHLCEVIQYTPMTKTVHSKPLLIIPPWINKFYILDLGEKKSYIRYMVEAGYTVFTISWKNPTADMSDTTFADYVQHGTIFAKEAIAAITGDKNPAGIGYCLGGTLLGVTQAYLKQSGGEAFANLTFFTTMLDFHDPGEVKLFLDERSIRHIEENMNKKGYLDGSEMGSTFAYLRAKDLLWNYFVDNYLLGKTPRPFDILAWNADSTRMPAKMHSWYLRNMYLNNLLRVPGALNINGVALDLTQITEDIYCVGCETDHIAPAATVFSMHDHTRAKVRYVLGSSGHIAGIVNPASKGKGYHYVAEPIQAPHHSDLETWKSSATKNDGSWWTDHEAWLKERCGKRGKVPSIGSESYPVLDAAPGRYVMEK
jgi:polyhydroxyalkanoate synthase